MSFDGCIFDTLVEGAADGILAFDAQYRYTLWNPAMERMTGLRRADVVGQQAFELFPFLRESGEDRLLTEALAGRSATSTGQRFWIPVTGRIGYYHARYLPVRAADGQVVGGLGFVRDVTEERHTREALQRSERRFRAIFEQAPLSIQLVAQDGRTLLANRAFEELWQVSRDVLDEYNLFRDPLLVEQGVLPSVQRAFAGETIATEPIFYDPAANGQPGRARWTQALMYPIKDDAGAVEELALLHQDVTERVEIDRRKDEFLATLAHELRNPLAPILTAAELLKLRASDDPTVTRAQQTIARQVKHMQRLIDDLLDVARLTRGAIELRPELVDLHAVVEHAVEMVQPLIEARRLELQVELSGEAALVKGDPIRLEQVIGNLLSNAIKFTPPGGELWIAVTPVGAEAVVRVRDTGKGIPPELLSHVFDLFAQANPSIDRSEGGLGLGLTLARSLVEMHGGSISGHSEGAGKGSEFVVRLPLAPAERATPAKPDPAPRRSPGRLCILVVDDNHDAAESLAELLTLWDHEVSMAHDGVEALSRARQLAPDVILLDIGMPGMDGFEVARRMRADAALARVRLIALTGYGSASDRQKTRQAGFDYHLTKPVDLDALEALLEQLALGPGLVPSA